MSELENKKNAEHLFRFKSIGIFLAICLAALTSRLFFLQVVMADEYTTMSDRNQIRILSTPARRGNIYDKNMQELAISKPIYAVALISTEIDDKEDVAKTLSGLLQDPEITPEFILDKIKTHVRSYEPIIIKRFAYEEGLSIITQIEEMRVDLPGVMIMEEPTRYYPMGSLAGQVIGTVGLISADEQDLVENYGYSYNDWIGKTGLEKTMERFTVDGKEIGLRGKKGAQKVEVNAKHRPVATRSTQDAVTGNSIKLTLDSNLQRVMEDTLVEVIGKIQKTRPKAQAGAAVLMDVKTGGVLAMVSYPFMDPNDFATGLSKEKTAYYWDENLKPMFNRAVSGTYPPGSTFKMVTAVAAVAFGGWDPNERINCTPSAWVQPKAKCPRAHGNVNMYEALGVSCNNYFQEIAKRAGSDALYQAGWQLGLGHTTGIDLPGEAAGLLPNEEWKNQRFSGWEQQWRLYDTYYMSMGQGYNLFTPIQMANYIATIANGGKNMQPHLVDQVLTEDGIAIWTFEPVVQGELSLTSEQLALIQRAMLEVTTGRNGTARSLFANFPADIKVAAKTGTAQTGLVGDDKDKDYHGIFVAYAPYDDPQIAFAGVMEYGFHGGSSMGLVCKAVFEEYFGLNSVPLPDELPESME